MSNRITVIVSQSPSQNPARRQLEEDIVTALILEPGFDVTVIPNLYDLRADSTGMLALKGVSGPMVVCAWLFPRAAHWILDRNQIEGEFGTTTLIAESDDDDDDEIVDEDQPEEKARVIDRRTKPGRRIYCLDLRFSNQAQVFIEEIKRIRQEQSVRVVPIQFGAPPGKSGSNHSSQPTAEQLARLHQPTNDTALKIDGTGVEPVATDKATNGAASVQRMTDLPDRRWYPVIDYSRCTNCMECIDFCLFGVYGVDKIDTILVEQPDNCRKGCPACSRVCPENAIIFPQHKTPAIAGSAEVGASLKIDLSELFGAPQDGKSALEVAATERDEQLVLAGRKAVGLAVGIRTNSADAESGGGPPDELDSLMEQVDNLDL